MFRLTQYEAWEPIPQNINAPDYFAFFTFARGMLECVSHGVVGAVGLVKQTVFCI